MAKDAPKIGRIGIVGAMKVEVKDLVHALDNAHEVSLGQVRAWTGELSGVSVAIVQSGVGKAAAAALTQALLSKLPISALVNTGVAGALDPKLAVGDVVVSTFACYHDVDATALGYPLGVVPGFPKRFEASYALARTFIEASATEGLKRALLGGITSGDRFVNDPSERARIRSVTECMCCEMEGAALAQVAFLNKVPFVICRAISDEATGTSPIAYARFEVRAAKAMSRRLRAALPALSQVLSNGG